MKLHIEVKASERLPKKTDYYNTDSGSGLFSESYFISDDEHFKNTWRENASLVWLEPFEIIKVSNTEWIEAAKSILSNLQPICRECHDKIHNG